MREGEQYDSISLSGSSVDLPSTLKTPRLAITAILAIALASGTATSIFSVLRAVRFQRLPFADPERIVSINTNPRPRIVGRLSSEMWASVTGGISRAFTRRSENLRGRNNLHSR